MNAACFSSRLCYVSIGVIYIMNGLCVNYIQVLALDLIEHIFNEC